MNEQWDFIKEVLAYAFPIYMLSILLAIIGKGWVRSIGYWVVCTVGGIGGIVILMAIINLLYF